MCNAPLSCRPCYFNDQAKYDPARQIYQQIRYARDQRQEAVDPFVKGKIAKIEEKANGNLAVRYEDIERGGAVKETEHDLVVLSVGLLPAPGAAEMFPGERLPVDDFRFIGQADEDLAPGATGLEGVIVAGAASGPMDIPDSVLHAGAAAIQAAARIERMRKRP